MKIEKPVLMQTMTSLQRTRSPETFELVLQKARDQAARLAQGIVLAAPAASGSIPGALATQFSQAGGGATDFSALQQGQMDANMQYLRLQMEVQAENRWFSTVSNVIKSRHDTARAAINNLRA